jgi:hypothetical protein
MTPVQRLTAYHEAAHALIAWCLGFDVFLLELYDDATSKTKCSDGQVRYRCPVFDSKRERAICDCLIAVAGSLQEARMGSAFKLLGNDMKSFLDLAAIVEKDELGFLVPRIREIVENLIGLYAVEIDLLAKTLLRNGRMLEGDELKLLLGDPVNPRAAIEHIAEILDWKCPVADYA